MRGYIPPSGDELVFVKKIADQVQAVSRSGGVRTTLFLNDREQALAQIQLAQNTAVEGIFDGGYPQAERKMLRVYEAPLYDETFPIVCLRIDAHGTSAAQLTHRDYLGAMMGLRLKRECIGDIVLDATGATVFVAQKFASILQDELFEIGRVSVQLTQMDATDFAVAQQEQVVYKATLSSLRLDALLGAMLHVSRGNASNLIRAKSVMVNHVETTATHAAVWENDVFHVRGYGKYKLCEIGAKTKKDRIFVSYIKY